MAPKRTAESVPQAREAADIRSNFYSLTEARQVRAAIGGESRAAVREFLESVDARLTVGEVLAATEGE